MKIIAKVIAQGEPIAVQSQKAEGGQVMKCHITLQEFGSKYEDTFSATMLGSLAQCKFYAGELVAAALRFTIREHNGQTYQDIVVNEIHKIKN